MLRWPPTRVSDISSVSLWPEPPLGARSLHMRLSLHRKAVSSVQVDKSGGARAVCPYCWAQRPLARERRVRGAGEESPAACSTLGLRVLDGGRNLSSRLSEG